MRRQPIINIFYPVMAQNNQLSMYPSESEPPSVPQEQYLTFKDIFAVLLLRYRSRVIKTNSFMVSLSHFSPTGLFNIFLAPDKGFLGLDKTRRKHVVDGFSV